MNKNIKQIVSYIHFYKKSLDYKLSEIETSYVLKDYTKHLKNYYVYLLINSISKRIFYIGKGKKQRAEQHFKNFKKNKETNIFKIKEFKNISKYHTQPVIKIIADNLDEDTSLKIETKLIKKLFSTITNISQNEGYKNSFEKELSKIIKNIPTFEQWLNGIYRTKPFLFEILKEKNYGYDLYKLAYNTIIQIAKEYELCH